MNKNRKPATSFSADFISRINVIENAVAISDDDLLSLVGWYDTMVQYYTNRKDSTMRFDAYMKYDRYHAMMIRRMEK
jgi:hypothetical protein